MYDYTQVLFAAALGFFVFGEAPDWLSVLGYVLICGAGSACFFITGGVMLPIHENQLAPDANRIRHQLFFVFHHRERKC